MTDVTSEPGRKRVLIVDDHYIVRRGLTELLSQQPEFGAVSAVGTAEEAIQLVDQQPFDLAIVDISLGQMDGLELTNWLKQRRPELVVLILSMHDEQHYGERAQRVGAAGYVAKQRAGDTLLEAVRQVLGGQTYYRAGV